MDGVHSSGENIIPAYVVLLIAGLVTTCRLMHKLCFPVVPVCSTRDFDIDGFGHTDPICDLAATCSDTTCSFRDADRFSTDSISKFQPRRQRSVLPNSHARKNKSEAPSIRTEHRRQNHEAERIQKMYSTGDSKENAMSKRQHKTTNKTTGDSGEPVKARNPPPGRTQTRTTAPCKGTTTSGSNAECQTGQITRLERSPAMYMGQNHTSPEPLYPAVKEVIVHEEKQKPKKTKKPDQTRPRQNASMYTNKGKRGRGPGIFDPNQFQHIPQAAHPAAQPFQRGLKTSFFHWPVWKSSNQLSSTCIAAWRD